MLGTTKKKTEETKSNKKDVQKNITTVKGSNSSSKSVSTGNANSNPTPSEMVQLHDFYVANGMSDEEAQQKVFIEYGKQLGLSLAGGAISGGVMGGGATAFNRVTGRGNGISQLNTGNSAIDNSTTSIYNNVVGNDNVSSINGGNIDGINQNSGTGIAGVLEGRTESGNQDSAKVVEPGKNSTGNSGVSQELVVISPENKLKLNNVGVTSNEFRSTVSNPELFSFALDAARHANKNGLMVSPQSASDLLNGNVKTFLTKDGLVGGAVETDGNITGVFKNTRSTSKRAIVDIIITALQNGGNKLDCYGDFLLDSYMQLGFEPVAKVKFEREYADPDWNYDVLGEPDIYVMKHNGKNVSDVIDDYVNGTFRDFSKEEIDALPYMEYNAARKYRDMLLNEKNLTQATETGKSMSVTEVHSPSGETGPVPAAQGGASSLLDNGIPTNSENVNVQQESKQTAPDSYTKFVEDMRKLGIDQDGTFIDTTSGNKVMAEDTGLKNNGTVYQSGQKQQAQKVSPELISYPSRVATNTFKNSDMFKSVQKNIDMLNGEIDGLRLNVDKISERESLNEAADNLANDYDGTVKKLEEKEAFTGVNTDEAMMVMQQKLEEAKQTGDYSEAKRWMRVIADKAHALGQGLQAFAKYSRTAEGTIVKGESYVKKSNENFAKENPKQADKVEQTAEDIWNELEKAKENNAKLFQNKEDLNFVSRKQIERIVKDVMKRNGMSGKFNSNAQSYIAEQLSKGIDEASLNEMILTYAANGVWGLSESDIEQIISLFDEAENYGEFSKKRYDIEQKAISIIANKVANSDNFKKYIMQNRSHHMRYVKPYYYDYFQCIADKCPDTCCAGWQIVIDDKSLEQYADSGDAFCIRLQNSVNWQEGCFLQYHGRCAMLNEQNLCDLVIEKGEEWLCDTCDRYPRHVEEFDGVREMSLSLSCPVAAEMMLQSEEPVRFLIEEDEAADPLEDEFEDFDFLLFTQLEDARGILFSIVQNRKISIELRMAAILKLARKMQECVDEERLFDMDDVLKKYAEFQYTQETNAERRPLEEVSSSEIPDGEKRFLRLKESFGIFYKLEHLREDWTEVITGTEKALYAGGFDQYSHIYDDFYSQFVAGLGEKKWEIFLEQILMFFLYTYFCGAVYDDCIYSKVAMAVFSACYIQEFIMGGWYLAGKQFSIQECTRLAYRYAREVEHSDENLNLLEEWLMEKM